MVEMNCTYKILGEKFKGRDCLGNLGVDGKIILKRFLHKFDVRVWTGLNNLRTVIVL
jgi:hypothetical protein